MSPSSQPAHQETIRFAPLTAASLETLLPIEQQAYSHPWTHGNFIDALAAGYEAQMLLDADDQLLGYFVAMAVLDEVHLLNLTVAPAHQGRGWARIMLEGLSLWSRQRQALWLWLEVRASNARARAIYEKHGFQQIAERKNYYPAVDGQREHAIIMSLKLWP
ncbi:ribosomal protein S18-alanine N-acetyltransferase [Pantoea sp. 18069]|uniref:ribosomal protein S18-alanine N-acetyltransferase n=1 Tax=Pantoea sp. 18069 TaxID=2681415 RepID=UPI00135987C8|nr:ribosomal protein S18-alanine N-acetyltransferase [Pantoea sp. 18069]